MSVRILDVVAPANATLGEGPFWDDRNDTLHWVDIDRGVIHRLDATTGQERTVSVGQAVGSAVPLTQGRGWIAGVRDGVALIDDDGTIVALVDVERDRPTHRMNDGACDSHGRFWTGTMDEQRVPGMSALYCVRSEGDALAIDVKVSGVSLSNGIGWSPDDTTMYYVDTPTGGLDQFSFDATTGSIHDRRRLVDIALTDGVPDGLAVDADGCIWLALWQGRSIRRYTPDGALDQVVDLPVSQVTSCAFGGSDRRTLFITSASTGLSPSQLVREPLAGAVFALDTDVAGVPVARFAGSLPGAEAGS